MNTFNHLAQEERFYIYKQLKQGVSKNQIAIALGRHKSTIGREITRNTGQCGYRYKQAERIAKQRHLDKPKNIKMTTELQQIVTPLIKEKWSPDCISGRLKEQGKDSVSHETIYRYILANKAAGGDLYTYLRHQAKPYRKRYGKNDYRGTIPNRVDIDERPQVVDDKARLGDWEADTVIGKGHKGVLVTLTERVSKLNFAISIGRKESELTKEAIINTLAPFKHWVHTITFDNGREFCAHEAIAKALDCNTYFAKPYHSWQRGLNENHNGLLRQYFPKKEPLDNVTQGEVDDAITALNHRPRKGLNYRTPWEVFCQITGLDINKSHGVAFIA